MKKYVFAGAALLVAAVVAAPSHAVTPGPTSLVYSGKVVDLHCGNAACQARIDGFPLTNGWVGLEIRATDTIVSGLTKVNKWTTVATSKGQVITFSITDTNPSVDCNPAVCGDGVSAVAELQDLAE